MPEANGDMILLDPTSAPVSSRKGALAPRLGDLTGKRLVLVHNGKAGADQILGGLAQRLAERYGVTADVYRRSSPSKPLKPHEVREVASKADFAIAGVGD